MLLIVGTVRLPPDRLDAARPVMRTTAEDVVEPGLIHVRAWYEAGQASSLAGPALSCA